MAWKGVITNAGQQMLNQYIAGGHVLHIDGAKVGSGTTAESSMRAATALNSQKDTAAVMNKTASGDSTKIRVQVGPHATTAYTAREIGVWAHIDSNASQLMCLNQDTEGGVAIPTKGQSQDFAFTLNVVVAVSNTDSLVVEDDPDAYVSLGTMQAAIAAATPDASSSAKGLMSSADKTKLDGIAAGANNYTHPSYTARTGKPTANAAPAFGGTVTVSQVTSDGQGHVTGMTDRTITIPGNEATPSAKGLMSADDKTKLDGLTGSAASQSAAGYMSAADKAKLDGIAANANNYSHPSYTARTGKPTANAAPAFGGTVTVSQVTSDGQGHVTGMTDRTITIPGNEATPSAKGLMSADDKSKLDGLTGSAASQSAAGYMSAADKAKLDGIAAGANAYTHPAYTQRNTGFYKVHVDAKGHVDSVTNVAASDITGLVPAAGREATTSANGLMSAADKSNLDTKCIREKARPTAYTSLDQFTEPGVYYVSGNTVPNGWPVNYSGGDNCILEVIRAQGASASVVAYTQRLTGNTNSTAGVKLFVRGKYGTGAWRPWLEVKTEYYE